jgi:hypothetical protein
MVGVKPATHSKRLRTKSTQVVESLFFLSATVKIMLKIALLFLLASDVQTQMLITRSGLESKLRAMHCCPSLPTYDACATTTIGGVTYTCADLESKLESGCCGQPLTCITQLDQNCGASGCGVLPASCESGSGEPGSGEPGSG